MKIAVLGTGMVGETIGAKLVALGHEVRMGSRTATNEKAAAWVKKTGSKASAGTFADAAAFGELVFNCTLGSGAVEALVMAGEGNLAGKVVIDVSNPLDFSKGMPPSLFVSNTDSLGEQLQRRFPKAHVVKALNTMNCNIMVNPRLLADTHHTFLSGNDAGAKAKVKDVLKQFGWKDEELVDLGDITTARGTEQILPLWVRIWGATQNGTFNFKLVFAKQ
ncbi:MAG: NAD(P)-binding domain-containing protein [Myxococcaceae bacterium]|nr:NAD(P)-binding domain-containing protein [Myxococcaceae bacterium]